VRRPRGSRGDRECRGPTIPRHALPVRAASADLFTLQAAAYADGRVVLVERGAQRVLDPGPEIEDGSLAFSRTRLYRTRAGQPFSGPLQ
jgi:hypothetical protein